MCLEDFKKQYVNVHVCKFIDSYKYSSFKKHDDDERGFSCFKVDIGTAGDYTFCASQKNKTDIKKNANYKYSSVRIIVVRVLNGTDIEGGVEWVNGTFEHFEKDSYLECDNLKKGTYMVFVEWDW